MLSLKYSTEVKLAKHVQKAATRWAAVFTRLYPDVYLPTSTGNAC